MNYAGLLFGNYRLVFGRRAVSQKQWELEQIVHMKEICECKPLYSWDCYLHAEGNLARVAGPFHATAETDSSAGLLMLALSLQGRTFVPLQKRKGENSPELKARNHKPAHTRTDCSFYTSPARSKRRCTYVGRTPLTGNWLS